jgi:glycerol-3-phosphate acyltransferase PlsX
MNNKIIIAVDAMGGENSPEKIVDGIELSLKESNENFFRLYGNKDKLNFLVNKKSEIKKYCEIIHCDNHIEDEESPLSAAKKSKSTSMWQSIESQNTNKSQITLSAGNTGALLILSRLILNMIDGIEKPALAGLWPNKIGMNVVLDLGANIECNDKDLIDFSSMGAALYKSLYPIDNPKIALLNVGLEEIKGHEEIKKAYQYLKEWNEKNFEFYGYIEGNHIMDGNVNVIVTDGFTGNIALKTAEGTANFITKYLKENLSKGLLNKISLLFSYNVLKRFKEQLDPRKYNGAILLGLSGPVVKSHGSTDSRGLANSIKMCNKIVKGKLIEKIKKYLSN